MLSRLCVFLQILLYYDCLVRWKKKLSTTRVYSDGRENGRKTFDSHALEARNFRISISLDIPIQIPSPLSAI